MTDTTSPGAPGAPDVFSAGADQIIDLFKRKGLFWKFTLATVSNTAANGVFYDVLTVPATLDGDETIVSARSLIGPVSQGARVAIIYVPPTGYYIVGYVNNPGHGFRQTENGTKSVTFTSVTSFTVAISFKHPFATVPVMSVNIASGSGTTAQWHGRAINITNTGFTLFVFVTTATGAGTWVGVGVQWTANEQTP
jgi:hypothetical protein